MKNCFIRILSIFCAAMIMCCAVCAGAGAEEATPTDLAPAEAHTPSDKGEEDAVLSAEVIITKTLKMGETWEGKMKKTEPAVLKLDVARAGTVHMVVEGRNVWASVEKADQISENPPRTETDPSTARVVISWEAGVGSYLIILGPTEPNLMARAAVSFLDDEAFSSWEAEQADTGSEPEDEPETEDKPDDENVPAPETAPERHITVEVSWDVPNPVIGDTAHMKANLVGYEELTYTVQWQYSPDQVTWYDIPGETNETMDVVVTRENNVVFWRILVYVEENAEE